jgi:hypothetical protein
VFFNLRKVGDAGVIAWLTIGDGPRALTRLHVENDRMANVTKGLKKLRKRVKKLAAEVADGLA